MRRFLIVLTLILALALPASARPLNPSPRHYRPQSSWLGIWHGFVRVIGTPFRLFDDTGTHVIPIISPIPGPGGTS
jgi:hypothetical protein